MGPEFDWSGFVAAGLEFIRNNALGLALTLAIIFALYRVVVHLANRYLSDTPARLAVIKWSGYVALWFSGLWVLIVYGIHRQKDLFFLIGIFLAATAFSLRDVFSNFIGWTVIMSSRSFRERDRIRIDDVSGDVIDIGLFRTVIAEIGEWVEADQSTGRLVTIPNKFVLERPVYNYTQGHDYLWNEFKVMVTFDSDWEKAEKIVLKVVEDDFNQQQEQIRERLHRARRRLDLTYTYITPKVYVTIADSGVLLTARYLVRARRRRTLDDVVTREVLRRFGGEKSIDFAYPSHAIYRAELRLPGGGTSNGGGS
jgi:small-conductance mechanosensitive channel